MASKITSCDCVRNKEEDESRAPVNNELFSVIKQLYRTASMSIGIESTVQKLKQTLLQLLISTLFCRFESKSKTGQGHAIIGRPNIQHSQTIS